MVFCHIKPFSSAIYWQRRNPHLWNLCLTAQLKSSKAKHCFMCLIAIEQYSRVKDNLCGIANNKPKTCKQLCCDTLNVASKVTYNLVCLHDILWNSLYKHALCYLLTLYLLTRLQIQIEGYFLVVVV